MADPTPPKPTESAPPPRKRGWFQFHLSTAVILMFVAGGLIGLNVHERRPSAEEGWVWLLSTRGWPWAFSARDDFWWNSSYGTIEWHTEFFLLDMLVGLSVLAGVAMLLEWLLRRRERKS